MFSTDFILRQQENFVDNQKCQAGFRPLCNKILFLSFKSVLWVFLGNWEIPHFSRSTSFHIPSAYSFNISFEILEYGSLRNFVQIPWLELC